MSHNFLVKQKELGTPSSISQNTFVPTAYTGNLEAYNYL